MKPKLIVLGLMSGLLLGLFIAHNQILNITNSLGVSNGPPYCLICLNVKTGLLKPDVGDYASHKYVSPVYGELSVRHKVVGVNSSHYILVYYWQDDFHVYTMPINSSMQKVIHTFHIYTTNDFELAWNIQEKTLNTRTGFVRRLWEGFSV